MIDNTNTSELSQSSTDDILKSLADHTPRMVQPFKPSDGLEVRNAFLSGKIDTPIHNYPALTQIHFQEEVNSLEMLKQEVEDSPQISPKYKEQYEDSVGESLAKLRMLEIAAFLKHAENDADKNSLREEFMRLNIEIYGEPERAIYNAMIFEIRNKYDAIELNGRAENIRLELLGLLPDVRGEVEKFVPSEDTVKWVRKSSNSLYGRMFSALDKGVDSYDAEGIRTVFETILEKEFGESADGWTVVVTPGSSIEVQRLDKRIAIPANKVATKEELKGLIAHEIGVHFLRVIMGDSTDMTLMATGFKGYYDVEEGVGMVVQQAVTNGYKEAGVNMYLAASMAHFDNKSFKEVHEILWRVSLLDKITKGKDYSEFEEAKTLETSYATTQRIFRGTDDLPWFKDLSYYNGTTAIWKHMEQIRGDDLQLFMILSGKINPLEPSHIRTVLETKSI